MSGIEGWYLLAREPGSWHFVAHARAVTPDDQAGAVAEEDQAIDLLKLLIEAYEQELYPVPKTDPERRFYGP